MSEKIFFIYEHLRAEGKAVIHRSDCLWCRNGQGIHMRRGGRNGQWHGPFKTHDEAYMFADELGRPIRNCSHCNPEWKRPFILEGWNKEREQLRKVKPLK